MKTQILIAACIGLMGPTAAWAAGDSTSGGTPGHEMQENGSKAGSPGASGYAPGHEMKGDAGSSSSGSSRMGASGTSGSTSSTDRH